MNAKAPQQPPTAEELEAMGGKPHPSPPPPKSSDQIGIVLRKLEKGEIVSLPMGWTIRPASRVWVAMQVIMHDYYADVVMRTELIGVFTSEENAVAACKEPTDCVAPLELDAVAPRETTILLGAYYPLARTTIKAGDIVYVGGQKGVAIPADETGEIILVAMQSKND